MCNVENVAKPVCVANEATLSQPITNSRNFNQQKSTQAFTCECNWFSQTKNILKEIDFFFLENKCSTVAIMQKSNT